MVNMSWLNRLFGPKLTNQNRALGNKVESFNSALVAAGPNSITNNQRKNLGKAVQNWLANLRGYSRVAEAAAEQGPAPPSPEVQRNLRTKKQKLLESMQKLEGLLSTANTNLKNNALRNANRNIANANAVYKATGGLVNMARFRANRAQLAKMLSNAKTKMNAARVKPVAAPAVEAQVLSEAVVGNAANLVNLANKNLAMASANELNQYNSNLKMALAKAKGKTMNSLNNTNLANASYMAGAQRAANRRRTLQSMMAQQGVN